MKTAAAPVALIMGSDSDWPTLQPAAEACAEFGVACDVRVVSAHRTPLDMVRYARGARRRGVRVIIAGAGGAAHLPGMVAAISPLPVIGVPVKSSNSIDGWDSVLSILQMPAGIPVATVALNGAKNAGILAASIVGAFQLDVAEKLKSFKDELKEKVEHAAKEIETKGWKHA